MEEYDTVESANLRVDKPICFSFNHFDIDEYCQHLILYKPLIYFAFLGCKDISGEWRSSNGRKEVLNQNDCLGSSSDGYEFTVAGSKATTSKGLTGIIGISGITWSNGLTFVLGKL